MANWAATLIVDSTSTFIIVDEYLQLIKIYVKTEPERYNAFIGVDTALIIKSEKKIFHGFEKFSVQKLKINQ